MDACESLALFATKDENVFSFGKTQGEPSMIELGGVEESVKKPVKMIKSKDTVDACESLALFATKNENVFLFWEDTGGTKYD